MKECEEVIIEICPGENDALVFSSWPRYSSFFKDLGVPFFNDQAEGSINADSIEILDDIESDWEKDLWASWRIKDVGEIPQISVGEEEQHIIFQASSENPFWLEVGTDMPEWIALLETNPYALRRGCTLEYARYLLPLSLLKIS